MGRASRWLKSEVEVATATHCTVPSVIYRTQSHLSSNLTPSVV
jgi:hypothetical protein